MKRKQMRAQWKKNIHARKRCGNTRRVCGVCTPTSRRSEQPPEEEEEEEEAKPEEEDDEDGVNRAAARKHKKRLRTIF